MKEGHLVEENKADFLSQLNTIVQEQRDLAKAQLEDNEEDNEVEADLIEADSPSETTEVTDRIQCFRWTKIVYGQKET